MAQQVQVLLRAAQHLHVGQVKPVLQVLLAQVQQMAQQVHVVPLEILQLLGLL